MPDTVFVAGKVTVDTSGATPPVNELNKSLATTNTALKTVGTTSKQTTDAVKETGSNFQNLHEQISQVPGPLGAASDGVSKLSDAFKAMLANPVVLVITAIVGALAFLYKSFTNTAEGGEKMEATFAGIKAAASAVLDAIFNLGGAIIKFFSGDFKGAFDQAKGAITGVVDAVTDAYTQTSKLTTQLQQIRKDQAQNDIDQAKRAKDLAILREQATDPDVDVKARKAALLELQKAAQDDAAKDIDLAKRTADTKIALLSIGTDAAKKNYADIAKARVEQIQVETDAANEQRRIGKQITQANKEELAQQAADAKAAADKAKADREQLEAFNAQLLKLRQQNALAGITDQYAKEQQLLENHIADEKAAIDKQFADGKITRDQYNQLLAQEQISADAQRQALTDKHNAEVIANETKFQNELNDLKDKITLDGITNQYQKEQVQLDINHEKALQKALTDYGNDAAKLFQIKQAIDADYQQQQDALDAKHKADQEKKAFEDSKKHLQNQLNDPTTSLKAKQADIDAEQLQVQQAFDNKTLSEEQYNDEIAKLAEDRIAIKKKELAEEQSLASATVDLLGGIAEAVGEQTAAGKALAIAAATIKALQAEVTIIAGLSEVGPFGFIAGIAAAAAVGVGLFNTIKQIESVDIPGQSSSSSSVPSPISVSAPIAPTQAGTQLPQAQLNQIGQAQSQPVRAYVVESDQTAMVNREARLQSASVLGGH